MTKIVQFRRGTAAQNDNFTGMPGEITVDMDANTLRVHDGIKLGGYALARADNADAAGDGDAFDINSVSDDFWKMLFARFAPETFDIQTSPSVPMTVTGNTEFIFNSTRTAKYARVALNCIAADAGYSAGDIVWDCGIGDRGTPTPNVWTANDGIHAMLIAAKTDKWWVPHRTTGARTEITPEKWTMTVTVWC